MPYLLDTNVFIEAKNRHYGFDFCPAYWDWLDQAMLDAVRQVTAWAQSQQYEPGAVTTFLQAADSYLVAQALALGYTVVTHEVPSASRRKVKIPEACVGLRVGFVSPFQMLRNERARFVLARNA
jgi:hypothetical protein